MEFKDYILSSRKKLNMTQYEFAEAIGGASWITVWRWENGIVKPRSFVSETVKEKVNSLIEGIQND